MDSKTRFKNAVSEQFGFNSDEAETIYNVFKKAKVLKVDGVNGNFSLVHGAFWSKDVMLNALEM